MRNILIAFILFTSAEAPEEFFIAGTGIVVTFSTNVTSKGRVGILF